MSTQEVISDWFDKYSDDIYHYLIYRMGSTDVEDLVQEVFIKAIKGFSTFQGTASPKTWLISIARNVAIDEIRRSSRRKWLSLNLFENTKGDPRELPEYIVNRGEETRELYTAILSLKGNYREVIILRGIKEFSVSETSIALNWSENKVRSTYHRARIALKKKLGANADEEQV